MTDTSHTDVALPVLDMKGAAEFLELSRNEIMVLVPEAVIEIRARFGMIKDNLTDSDFDAAARNTHTLKSVANSVGAYATMKAAENLEMAARQRDGETCAARLPLLKDEFRRLIAVTDTL